MGCWGFQFLTINLTFVFIYIYNSGFMFLVGTFWVDCCDIVCSFASSFNLTSFLGWKLMFFFAAVLAYSKTFTISAT